MKLVERNLYLNRLVTCKHKGRRVLERCDRIGSITDSSRFIMPASELVILTPKAEGASEVYPRFVTPAQSRGSFHLLIITYPNC